MADFPIELAINGKGYRDFKSGQVTMSMDTLARSFSFEFTDKWFNSLLQEMPFVEGDPISVRLYGESVIEGWIEDIPIDYGANSRSIGVVGRSKACDLVDCSAISNTGSWRNVGLLDIASAVVLPFGVGVILDPAAIPQAATPFTKYAIEDEETAFECIARAARMRGLFPISDALGNVIITKSGTLPFPYVLQYPLNVKRGTRRSAFKERFSQYIIKSQTAGDDIFNGDVVSQGYYVTEDPQVKRYRPLIVIADGQGKQTELQTRGDWERNYRAGNSRRLTYEHKGFRTPVTNRLFELNKLIPVVDPVVDFDGVLLIASITYTYGWPGGENTTLELAAPETYNVLIPPPPRPRRSGGPLW